MTHAEAGAKGGLARARNHSHEQIAAWGRLGTWRLPTIQELESKQRINEQRRKAVRARDIPNDYKGLLRLWKSQQKRLEEG